MGGKPIVVAVDGSDEALSAAEWAAGEALRHNAPLRIVSVPGPPPRLHVHQGARSIVANALHEEAARAVRTAVSRVTEIGPGLDIASDVLSGDPAASVTRSGSDAAMLVVGARGVGGFSAMTLGSVSGIVAGNASCPVVVVHGRPAAARREVVVGIRDIENSDRVLSFAFEEAALAEAGLMALHAWHGFVPDLRVAGEHAGDPGLAMAQTRRQLADMLMAWQEKYPAVQVTTEVVHGHPARELASLSARAELVVLGRRSVHGPGRGAGFVRHSVLGHAHGPVAVIPA